MQLPHPVQLDNKHLGIPDSPSDRHTEHSTRALPSFRPTVLLMSGPLSWDKYPLSAQHGIQELGVEAQNFSHTLWLST